MLPADAPPKPRQAPLVDALEDPVSDVVRLIKRWFDQHPVPSILSAADAD